MGHTFPATWYQSDIIKSREILKKQNEILKKREQYLNIFHAFIVYINI